MAELNTIVTPPADQAAAVIGSIDIDQLPDLAATLTDYKGFRDLLKRYKKVDDGATNSWTWHPLTAYHHSTKGVDPWEPLTSGQTPGVKDCSVTPVLIVTTFAYNVRDLKVIRNSTGDKKVLKRRIYDHLAKLKAQAYGGKTEWFESQIWEGPTDESDTKHLLGFYGYWLTSGTSKGFTGNDPTGFSSGAGGLLKANASRWCNYWDSYTSGVIDIKVVDALREAADETNWQPVIEPTISEGANKGSPEPIIYTTKTNRRALANLARQQNAQAGLDLGWDRKRFHVSGMTIEPVAWLEKNKATKAPFIGIDWRWWQFREDGGMRISGETMPYDQPLVRNYYEYLEMNIICKKRDANFLIEAE
ncbi:MAG: hypothetical protein DRP01_04940 [Archaeoglobales archaeon]|nr:MAG: hypothetical protein DRP01_04940 [Archaeoglobales archaeon]